MQQIPILPQKSNYTIHITQVATTNTTLTPTADFSETEESANSVDNEAPLSCQEVKGRGKIEENMARRTTKLIW
jgi:hypothetical protein